MPLAPEVVLDPHCGLESVDDCLLYPHLLALLTELRERYFVLSHSGCGGSTRNPKLQLGRGYAMLDQISFTSWLEEGHDCHVPLKIVDWEDSSAYFAWSQHIITMPKDTPVSEIADRLQTAVEFRGKIIPLIEVAFQGFLGHADASQFLKTFNQQ